MAFDASEVTARLAKARADRTAIGSLSAELDGFNLAEAYDVQRRLRNEAGPLAGWKLGLTSRAKQAQVGVAAPICGFLPASAALDPSPTDWPAFRGARRDGVVRGLTIGTDWNEHPPQRLWRHRIGPSQP